MESTKLEAAFLEPPMSALRWGILSSGRIARVFAEQLAASVRGRLVAVASRDPDRAEEFAAGFEDVRARQEPSGEGARRGSTLHLRQISKRARNMRAICRKCDPFMLRARRASPRAVCGRG